MPIIIITNVLCLCLITLTYAVSVPPISKVFRERTTLFLHSGCTRAASRQIVLFTSVRMLSKACASCPQTINVCYTTRLPSLPSTGPSRGTISGAGRSPPRGPCSYREAGLCSVSSGVFSGADCLPLERTRGQQFAENPFPNHHPRQRWPPSSGRMCVLHRVHRPATGTSRRGTGHGGDLSGLWPEKPLDNGYSVAQSITKSPPSQRIIPCPPTSMASPRLQSLGTRS